MNYNHIYLIYAAICAQKEMKKTLSTLVGGWDEGRVWPRLDWDHCFFNLPLTN